MAREMTDEEKMEYDRLTANMEQMRLRLDELTAGPVVYGYARVSTYGQAAHGNSLEEQKRQGRLGEGDTLIVTKLDRLGRSVAQASALITSLLDAGVTINVLNLGVLSNNSVSTLMRNILLCFAQYERDMIVERTQEGRAVARRKPGYREGRPRKYSRAQIEHALFLLDDHSYKQVADMTGISKATLARERRKHTIDV